jgi:hypothetical protein
MTLPALLSVMVVEARNLACLDAVSPLPPMQPHAYISCGLGSALKATHVAGLDADPKFECTLNFGVVDVAPSAPPLLLGVCAVNATPLLQLTESLGNAELDLLRLFGRDFELARLRAGAEGCSLLRDAWVALEGVGTGEVHLRLSLRSVGSTECDLSLSALALAERARAAARGRAAVSMSPLALEMAALEMSTERYLKLLEARQFWKWLRALQANPWLLSETAPHASARRRGGSFVALVRGGLPSRRTVNRLAQQVVVTGDAGHRRARKQRHLSNIAARVSG